MQVSGNAIYLKHAARLLQYIHDNKLIENVNEVGEYLRDRLKKYRLDLFGHQYSAEFIKSIHEDRDYIWDSTPHSAINHLLQVRQIGGMILLPMDCMGILANKCTGQRMLLAVDLKKYEIDKWFEPTLNPPLPMGSNFGCCVWCGDVSTWKENRIKSKPEIQSISNQQKMEITGMEDEEAEYTTTYIQATACDTPGQIYSQFHTSYKQY